ncbi:hypothetical protein VU08_09085 [Desulfobulbus sp. F5]|nr:hypothetical protein [Desulfobulbus sp. F5]
MLGAEGNKDYIVKTIKYKVLLVAETTLPFGTIKKKQGLIRFMRVRPFFISCSLYPAAAV